MRYMVVMILMLVPLIASAATTDVYDNKYCKDPIELQKWQKMLNNNPDSDAIAALHALWVGLCLKVETRNITTIRANKIFEDFRWGLIDIIQSEQEQSDKEAT